MQENMNGKTITNQGNTQAGLVFKELLTPPATTSNVLNRLNNLLSHHSLPLCYYFGELEFLSKVTTAGIFSQTTN